MLVGTTRILRRRRTVSIASSRVVAIRLTLLLSTDPFDPLENDPLKTNALSSSLWEIATLRNHYNGSVSGLAKAFEEVMSKQSYSMEDFLDHSYGTVRPLFPRERSTWTTSVY